MQTFVHLADFSLRRDVKSCKDQKIFSSWQAGVNYLNTSALRLSVSLLYLFIFVVSASCFELYFHEFPYLPQAAITEVPSWHFLSASQGASLVLNAENFTNITWVEQDAKYNKNIMMVETNMLHFNIQHKQTQLTEYKQLLWIHFTTLTLRSLLQVFKVGAIISFNMKWVRSEYLSAAFGENIDSHSQMRSEYRR